MTPGPRWIKSTPSLAAIPFPRSRTGQVIGLIPSSPLVMPETVFGVRFRIWNPPRMKRKLICYRIRQYREWDQIGEKSCRVHRTIIPLPHSFKTIAVVKRIQFHFFNLSQPGVLPHNSIDPSVNKSVSTHQNLLCTVFPFPAISCRTHLADGPYLPHISVPKTVCRKSDTAFFRF